MAPARPALLALSLLPAALCANVDLPRRTLRGALGLLHEEPDPDAVARDTFVRRCAVVLDVADPKLLPANALKKFCEETKHVVECRQRLVVRLKETHARGGSMTGFCGAAYDWFQKKYGMFCPEQCHKQQCKATCAWMKRQEKLKAVDRELSAKLEKTASVRAEVQALTSKVKDLEATKLGRRRALEQAQVEAARANASAAEAAAAEKTADLRAERLGKDAAAWETATARAKEELAAAEEASRQIGFAVDKAKVNLSGAKLDHDRVKDKLADLEGLLARTSANVADDKAEIEEIMAQVKADEQDLASLAPEILQTERAVEAAKESVRKARVKADERGGKELEALVDDQKRRLEAAEATAHEANRKRKELRDEVQRLNAQIERLGEALGQLVSKQRAQETKANATAQELRELGAKAAEAEARLEDLGRQKATAEADIKAKSKAKEKAKKTLFFATALAQDAAAKLGTAQASARAAAEKAAEAVSDLDDANASLQEATQVLAEATAAASRATADFEATNGQLLRRQEAQRNATRALEDDTPEIVRQHGLGLLEPVFARLAVEQAWVS